MVSSDIKPYQLLIIDDDPHIHKLLSKMLPTKKYSLQSAFNAADAVKTLSSYYPDLIILDMMMPQTSGIEFLDHIRKEETHLDTLVLILSAKDGQADRIEGLSHGADDYVVKPFHIRHLIRKIEHMLVKKG